MKKYLLFASLVALGFTGTNEPMVPGSDFIDMPVIRPERYETTWIMMLGKKEIEVGHVADSIRFYNGKLYAVAVMKMKNSDKVWVDSTIADSATLKPIRHTSQNSRRDMVLNFGNVITGFYHDHKKNEQREINDTLSAAYFDSNLYTHLVRWTKLEDGLKKDITIYNYDPNRKSGLMQMHIAEVKSLQFTTAQKNKYEIWRVVVTDDISPGLASVFYIRKSNRELLYQEIVKGKKVKMKMLRSDR
ncbi:MAG: hypothetical protein MUC87_20545 [Bacteroidia bacterium]|jgi:hypothetical protein|nr:hypothetical protein [Bacteroidia bacterium]